MFFVNCLHTSNSKNILRKVEKLSDSGGFQFDPVSGTAGRVSYVAWFVT